MKTYNDKSLVLFRLVQLLLLLFLVARENMVVGSQVNLRWVPLAGLVEEEKLRVSHLSRARCLPQPSDVSVPIYPSAVVVDVMWGRVQPDCELRHGWESLGGVRLVSKESFEDVVAWYRQRLVDYGRHQAPRGTIFIQEVIRNYLWDRDYYKYANISVLPLEDKFSAAGYATMIEINRPSQVRSPLGRD